MVCKKPLGFKRYHSYFVYHVNKILLFESDLNFLRSFLFTNTVYYPHPPYFKIHWSFCKFWYSFHIPFFWLPFESVGCKYMCVWEFIFVHIFVLSWLFGPLIAYATCVTCPYVCTFRAGIKYNCNAGRRMN